MFSKILVAFLAVFAVAQAQDAVPVVTAAGATSAEAAGIGAALKVTLSLSPPDVQAAAGLIKEKLDLLRPLIANAFARVDAEAGNIVEKLDSFLEKLQEEVEAATDLLEEEFRTAVSDVIDRIREVIEFKKDLILNTLTLAQQALAAGSQLALNKVELVSQFLQSGLKNFTQAVSASRLILPSIKDKINQAVSGLIAKINDSAIKTAIQAAADKLGGKVVSMGELLREIAAQLAAKGQVAAAAAFGAVAGFASTVSTMIGGISNVVGSISLGATAAISGGVEGAAGAAAGVGGSLGGSVSVGV